MKENVSLAMQAVTGSYNLSDRTRDKLVKTAMVAMEEHPDTRVQLRACQVILAADAHNLKLLEAATASQHGQKPADDDESREDFAAAVQFADARKLLTQLGERLAAPETVVVQAATPVDAKPVHKTPTPGPSANGTNGHHGTNGTNGKNGKH